MATKAKGTTQGNANLRERTYMPIIIIVFTLGGEEIWILKNSKLPILGYPHRPAHKQTLFSFGQVFVTREGGQTPRPTPPPPPFSRAYKSPPPFLPHQFPTHGIWVLLAHTSLLPPLPPWQFFWEFFKF